MTPPVIGRAMPTTFVAVIPTMLVTGSVTAGLATAVIVYPFAHLWFRWIANKG
jgi:uncharacterized protein (DUF2062 family)